MERGALVFDGQPADADLGGLASLEEKGSGSAYAPHGPAQARNGPAQARTGTARPPDGTAQARNGTAQPGNRPAQPRIGTPEPRNRPAQPCKRSAPANSSVDGEPALELSDVSVELAPRSRRALDGVELSIERGERVALAGANGAGKSTLLRACAGAIDPSGGRVSAPHGAALLGQHPGDYIVRERVADELPDASGEAALAALGLAWATEMDPRDLSGGERQRLALAIALAGRGIGGEPPGLVCLDEPTRGMDLARKQELAALIKRLSERGAAVFVATHDFEFAAHFAERAIVLDRGQIVADGGFDEVLSGAATSRVGQLLPWADPDASPNAHGSASVTAARIGATT